MNRLRPMLALLTTLATLGCQQTPTSGDSPRPSSPSSATVTWYTHDGAESLYHSAKYSAAEAMCKQAIEMIEKSKGPKSPELAPPLIDLATIYMRLAKYAEAKTVIDRAESVLDPKIPAQALMLGRLGINKGWRLYSLGETPAAQKIFEESRTLLETHQKGDSKDLAEIINNLALMYEETASENDDEEQLALAKRMLIQAWQMRRRVTGDNSPETAESLNNLGMNLVFNAQNTQQEELGLKTLQKSLEISQKLYGEEHPETAMAHTNVAMAQIVNDHYDAAEKEIKKALPVTTRFLGDKHPDRSYELTTLGRVLQEQTHYDEAEKAFLEAVAINETVYGKNHPNVASSLTSLAHLYEAKGDEVKQREVQRRIEKLSGKGI